MRTAFASRRTLVSDGFAPAVTRVDQGRIISIDSIPIDHAFFSLPAHAVHLVQGERVVNLDAAYLGPGLVDVGGTKEGIGSLAAKCARGGVTTFLNIDGEEALELSDGVEVFGLVGLARADAGRRGAFVCTSRPPNGLVEREEDVVSHVERVQELMRELTRRCGDDFPVLFAYGNGPAEPFSPFRRASSAARADRRAPTKWRMGVGLSAQDEEEEGSDGRGVGDRLRMTKEAVEVLLRRERETFAFEESDALPAVSAGPNRRRPPALSVARVANDALSPTNFVRDYQWYVAMRPSREEEAFASETIACAPLGRTIALSVSVSGVADRFEKAGVFWGSPLPNLTYDEDSSDAFLKGRKKRDPPLRSRENRLGLLAICRRRATTRMFVTSGHVVGQRYAEAHPDAETCEDFERGYPNTWSMLEEFLPRLFEASAGEETAFATLWGRASVVPGRIWFRGERGELRVGGAADLAAFDPVQGRCWTWKAGSSVV